MDKPCAKTLKPTKPSISHTPSVDRPHADKHTSQTWTCHRIRSRLPTTNQPSTIHAQHCCTIPGVTSKPVPPNWFTIPVCVRQGAHHCCTHTRATATTVATQGLTVGLGSLHERQLYKQRARSKTGETTHEAKGFTIKRPPSRPFVGSKTSKRETATAHMHATTSAACCTVLVQKNGHDLKGQSMPTL